MVCSFIVIDIRDVHRFKQKIKNDQRETFISNASNNSTSLLLVTQAKPRLHMNIINIGTNAPKE